MNTRISLWTWSLLALAVMVTAQAARGADQPTPTQDRPVPLLEKIGFDQNLDAQLPLDLTFRDERGKTVRLGDFFGKKPVILILVYYNCPMLCGVALKALARSLKPLKLSIGKEFDVVTVSIDPTEGPDLALAKKGAFVGRYDRPGAEKGWHFLTGDQANITALAKTVGFRYTYNPKTKLYAHAAGLVITTPEGRLARYIYGVDFPPNDLKFGLMEASAGKIGSPIAKLLLLCYHYDAAAGKYTLAILGIIRVLGCLTAVALGSYMALMFWRDRHGVSRAADADPLARTT
ncbi:MAG: SCO family protein [Isosphaeraceae bacterium]